MFLYFCIFRFCGIFVLSVDYNGIYFVYFVLFLDILFTNIVFNNCITTILIVDACFGERVTKCVDHKRRCRLCRELSVCSQTLTTT